MDKLLGKQAKDKITGFEGIITAKPSTVRVEQNGCEHREHPRI